MIYKWEYYVYDKHNINEIILRKSSSAQFNTKENCVRDALDHEPNINKQYHHLVLTVTVKEHFQNPGMQHCCVKSHHCCCFNREQQYVENSCGGIITMSRGAINTEIIYTGLPTVNDQD